MICVIKLSLESQEPRAKNQEKENNEDAPYFLS